MAQADPLELLLPRAPGPRLERARKVATFLRLVADDARPAPSGTVRVNLDRARAELERQISERLVGATLDLVRAHVGAALERESFLDLGQAGLTVQAAWSVLEEHRGELGWLPGVPEPGEPPLEVARRLLAGAERLGLPEDLLGLWRARLLRALSGPRAAEGELRALAAEEIHPGVRSRAVAGVAACLLDRGAVRQARELLEESAALAGAAPGGERLRRMTAWARLLAGDLEGARAAADGLGPWRGRLPVQLAELRRQRPGWVAALAGREPAPPPPAETAGPPGEGAPEPGAAADRLEIGASFLGVLALLPGGAVEPLLLDAAPALRRRVESWLSERDGACRQGAEPEHRLVASARAVVLHRQGPEPLRGALDPHRALSLALAPVLDRGGEVGGWLHVECEHHLVPPAARLRRWAEAWAPRVLAAAGEPGPGAPPQPPPARRPAPGHDDPLEACFRRLVASLGMKTSQRRWWGFAVDGEQVRPVAEGGGAWPDGAIDGGGRALARARKTGGVIRFDDPDPALALRAEAASGLVLPLAAQGRLRGLLAIESIRRRDFAGEVEERLAHKASELGAEIAVARFRAWHWERFGFDVHFDAGEGRFGRRVGDFLAAGRARSAAALIGPAGSGKQVIARWLHHEGGLCDAPLTVFPCGARDEPAAERELFEGPGGGLLGRCRGGTLVLDEIERLPACAQARLLDHLERAEAPGAAAGGPPARVVACSRVPLAQAGAEGRLRADLAQRLERLRLHVPPLCERREEIPALAATIGARFACEEGVAPPSFDDGALALLWRQPWEGNVRQLENVVYKLVLLFPGRTIDAGSVEELARRFQLELVRRLPSRRPDPELLKSALLTTRTLRGSLNKTRAALYLGWDPDTLQSRMAEARLGEPEAGEVEGRAPRGLDANEEGRSEGSPLPSSSLEED